MLFFNRNKQTENNSPRTLESLGTVKDYPVLDARALIELLAAGGKISSIRRHASVSPAMYESLYVPSLYRFIEAAQLQPASSTDHHAGLGGLITHTLEVVELAMSARRAYHLPVDTEPEQISREEVAWTYGVFVAALLHDAGKLLTLTRLVPSNDKAYSPMGDSILEAGADTYRIEWVSHSATSGSNTLYELQTRVSVSMLCMIPPQGMTMIGQNTRLLSELTGCLSNLPYEWGIIGKLCHDADRLSVSRDLQPGKARDQVSGAPTISLAARMIRALRAEIERLSLPLNRDGGTGWATDDTLWLVCKVAVTRIRTRLQDEGSTDIPHDDERLYDILLDHGYIIPSPDERAIWNVRVKCDDYDHALTMLRFERSRVVHPSRKIKPFEGEITPITREELDSLRRDKKTVAPSPTLDPAEPHSSEPDQSNQSANTFDAEPHLPPEPDIIVEPASNAPDQPIQTELTPDTNSVDSPLITSNKKRQKTVLVKPLSSQELDRKPTEKAAQALNDAVLKTRRDVFQDPVDLDHEHIGRYFLTWVREAIDSEQIQLDSPSPPVHVVEQGILLACPRTSKNFLQSTGLEKSQDKQALKTANNKIRKSLKKEKLIISRPKGFDVWQAHLPTRGGVIMSTLYCWVVPGWALFDEDEIPPINPDLELIEGDYNPNERFVKKRN